MPALIVPSPGVASLLLSKALLHVAELVDRLAAPEILELEELPHLDLALSSVDRRIGKAPRPLQRLFARLHLDDGVAGDQLLGLGERAVDDGALRSRVLDAPALGARLQPGGVEQHPR